LPPVSGPMFPSLVSYITNFVELVKVLDVTEYAAVSILCNGLKGPLATMLQTTVQLTADMKLSAAVELVYSTARMLDRAHQIEPRAVAVHAACRVPSARPAEGSEQGRRRLQITRPQMRTPTATQLSSAERGRCLQQRLCFLCKQPGHQQDQCPNSVAVSGATATTPASAAAPSVASPGAHQQQQQQQRQPSQRLHRQIKPPARFADYDTQAVEDADATTGKMLLTLKVEGSQPPQTILALPDTGAACCHIRWSYAASLRLPLHPSPRREFVVADGARIVSDTTVDIPLRLAPQAPVCVCWCWVHDSVPHGDHVLLGRDALTGFAIKLSTPPQLTFIQSTSLEDLVDPVDPPEPATSATVLELCPPPATASAPCVPVPLGEKLSAEERSHVTALLAEFSGVFSPINTEPAVLPPFRVELVPGAEPFRCSPRPLSMTKRNFVRDEIDKLQ